VSISVVESLEEPLEEPLPAPFDRPAIRLLRLVPASKRLPCLPRLGDQPPEL
jgi:hypothetical protein